jgi:putative membrane protein
MKKSRSEYFFLLSTTALVLIWSGISPHDRATWILEVLPVLIVAPLLLATYRRFPLTPLLYRLIVLHAVILIIGGHYTYARVPVGFWVQDWFDLGRNHYDRLGHLAQGFIPAIAAREILLRTSPLRRGKWLFVLCASICLAFSAFYEMIEWWAALVAGEGATDFLGTQGDIWDTQWDMFLALVGAVAALLTLAKPHDKALERLMKDQPSS